MATETVILAARHPVLRRRVAQVVQAAGLSLVVVDAPDALEEIPTGHRPAVFVVELELPGAVAAIAAWKARWPGCLVAAALGLPDQELWIAAEAAGAELVANRGALPRQLQYRLEARAAGGGELVQRKRLLAKRLTNPGDGLVGRVPDAPDGPIAIFRLGGRVCAIRDVCPHAGYSLADGDLDSGVITCPQHGSRFDVCSGARLRGPADYPIRTYPVVVDGDDLYVEI